MSDKNSMVSEDFNAGYSMGFEAAKQIYKDMADTLTPDMVMAGWRLADGEITMEDIERIYHAMRKVAPRHY